MICCPALIPRESGDSVQNPSLDAKAKLAVLLPCQERSLGHCRKAVPDSRSALTIGDFVNQKFPLNHSCVASRSRLDPPLPFFGENFLSGSNFGRVRLIRAQFGL